MMIKLMGRSPLYISSSPYEVHVVDHDSRRRAQLAFRLNGMSCRAYVYEDIDELFLLEVNDGLVILSDHDFSSSSQTMLADQLARRNVPFAIYSVEPNPRAIVKAMLEGALDYLAWPIDEDGTLEQLVLRAQQYQDTNRCRAQALVAVDSLSVREREVLVKMIDGFSSKAIAAQFGISHRTIEIHRSNLLRKLQVESSAGAVRIGIYAGLDEPCASRTPRD